MPALSLRLPEDLDHRLEDEARLEQLPRCEVVQDRKGDRLLFERGPNQTGRPVNPVTRWLARWRKSGQVKTLRSS